MFYIDELTLYISRERQKSVIKTKNTIATYMFYFGEPTIVTLRDRGKSNIKR